jgi:pyruvate/2-oxoglutarate dehydrogenase complex dihydrolipoamide dehydrogenase (E3) component
MSEADKYDILVLGSGTGGKLVAWTMAKEGKRMAVVDAHSDRILGFAVFEPDAGELMGTVQAAMLGRQPYPILRDAAFAHPTMTEGLKYLLAGVPPLARDDVKKHETASVPWDC